MAAITRRTWEELRDEVLKRIGRQGDTNAEGRVEYWIDAVYRRLCQSFHHFELHDEDTSVTLSTSTNVVTLPASTYIVMAVRLEDPGTNKPTGRLTPERPDFIYGRYDETSGKPEHYARIGDELHFDVLPDAAYPMQLLRYKAPTTPDFAPAAGNPEIGRLWDQYIIEGAAEMGLKGYWAPEMAGIAAQSLTSFLETTVQPPLVVAQITDRNNAPTISDPHIGGTQG